ncbi:MAG: ComEC/Rec2 family competence protein [Bryobacteraceae bacterium]
MRVIRLCLLLATLPFCVRGAKTLDIYFIDVEGGQSTLVVSPSGQALLIDAGFAGNGGRDADRIAAAASKAGVKQIDYLAITHYHGDHVGGVPEVAGKLPIKRFIDHGESVDKPSDLMAAYTRTRDKGEHIVAKPGLRIPLKGVDITVVAAAGAPLLKPLKGAGGANPLCASAKQASTDRSENSQSVGVVMEFGKFRFLDLGDLTADREIELACPENRIGKIDLFLTSHHATHASPAPLVHALAPRVAIMNNGARKGGSPAGWQVVRNSPGLEDFWQLHYSIAGGKENNSAEPLIANPEESCKGDWIKVSAQSNGEFTVTNGRTGFAKVYRPKK